MRVIFHGTGRYPTGTTIGPACWPHQDLLVVTKGSVSLTVGRQEVEMEEGDAVLIPRHKRFLGKGTDAKGAIWVLHFVAEANAKRTRLFQQGLSSPFARDLLHEITTTYRNPARDLTYLNALATALLARLECQSKTPPAPNIRNSRLLPHESATTPRHVHEMAALAGLSESHYRSQFRQLSGISPRQYLRNLKSEKARQLLRETRLPIKEIAVQVGYGDVVSFHRAFTAANGCTPARFRREGPLIA